MTPIKKDFNWGDVGIGIGTAGAAASLGLLGTALAKAEGNMALLAPLLPAAGAGVIAYWLRRRCPECAPCAAPQAPSLTIAPKNETVVAPGVRQRDVKSFIGYRGYGDDIDYRSEIVRMLGELGYDTSDLTAAIKAFQDDYGLQPPEGGGLDQRTLSALTQAYEAAGNGEKKSNAWKWVLGGVGVAAVLAGGIYLVTR